MSLLPQDWTARHADDKNPMQASSTVYTPLDTDVFIDDITSTIEGKLREQIESLINDKKAQRVEYEKVIKNTQLLATIRESDAEITKLTRTNRDLVNRVDELLKNHDDLATDNVQLIEAINPLVTVFFKMNLLFFVLKQSAITFISIWKYLEVF